MAFLLYWQSGASCSWVQTWKNVIIKAILKNSWNVPSYPYTLPLSNSHPHISKLTPYSLTIHSQTGLEQWQPSNQQWKPVPIPEHSEAHHYHHYYYYYESWDVNAGTTWSGSVNWCLAEGWGNGDQCHRVGLVAREGVLYRVLARLKYRYQISFWKWSC